MGQQMTSNRQLRGADVPAELPEGLDNIIQGCETIIGGQRDLPIVVEEV